MNISVIGLGYVGLSTALTLTDAGFHIIGLDNDKSKLQQLIKNKLPIHEPGLSNILKRSMKSKKIEFTSNYDYAIKNSKITFVCVGTPLNNKQELDLTFLKNSIKSLSLEINKKSNHLVVIKSTILPGTCDNIIKPILNKNCIGKFNLILNPEFLREGFALQDTLYPDRVILGIENKKDTVLLFKILQKFLKNKKSPTIMTSFVNAELIKYASNAFLATKISFANSISDICEKLPNSDIGVVMHGIGLDKRISNSFLNAGVGFGGSCLPKDLQALISFCNNIKNTPSLLQATIDVNKTRPKILVNKTKEKLHSINGKKIAILGLSFKPNTDDIRNAPSIEVIQELLTKNARLYVYDPQAMKNIESIFHEKINYSKNIEECLKNSDCCIILTEWDIFKKLSPQKIVRFMNKPIIIDGRRIFSNSNTSNIDYYCVGKNYD